MTKKFLTPILLSAFILSACSPAIPSLPTEKQEAQIETINDVLTEAPESKDELNLIPISNALSRVTKKPFGLKVSPKDSPVDPEKFSGYHTGVDFETFPDEKDSDVSIYAVCYGPIMQKRNVTGYGGTVVQRCVLDGTDVTVVYGHLKLSSIDTELNQNLDPGQRIGILGKGYSNETSGERKHLHLAIRKGKTINLLGYVQNPDLLDEWIDPMILFK